MTTKIPVELSSTPGIVDGSNATAITIDSSENVGIGTVSPTKKLHVVETSGYPIARFQEDGASLYSTLYIENANSTAATVVVGTGGGSVGNSAWANNAVFGTTSNANVVFLQNDTERMRIGSGGQVMINTTSSGNRAFNVLQLVAGETALYVENSGGTITSSTAPLAQYQFSGDSDVGDGTKFMEFQRQSDTIGSITALGAAVVYNTSSDRNLKENIVDASSQLNIIKNLQVREFDWKTNSRHDVGLIAQELHEHIPNVVTVGSDEKDVRGFTTPWSIDYGKLTPYLIKAIQEQQEQIEQLKTEIQTLKGE